MNFNGDIRERVDRAQQLLAGFGQEKTPDVDAVRTILLWCQDTSKQLSAQRTQEARDILPSVLSLQSGAALALQSLLAPPPKSNFFLRFLKPKPRTEQGTFLDALAITNSLDIAPAAHVIEKLIKFGTRADLAALLKKRNVRQTFLNRSCIVEIISRTKNYGQS